MANPNVVVITGGSRGIGAETARLFARHGYDVCLNYVENDVAAERVRSDILALGVRCLAVKADVSKADEVANLFRRVDQELGTLTVLVNNAAILNTQARLVDISPERFGNVLQKNVMSCFLCCKEAVQRMSTRQGGAGGSIVNVSSMAAKSGSPNEYVDYAASKGAVDTLTRGVGAGSRGRRHPRECSASRPHLHRDARTRWRACPRRPLEVSHPPAAGWPAFRSCRSHCLAGQ